MGFMPVRAKGGGARTPGTDLHIFFVIADCGVLSVLVGGGPFPPLPPADVVLQYGVGAGEYSYQNVVPRFCIYYFHFFTKNTLFPLIFQRAASPSKVLSGDFLAT